MVCYIHGAKVGDIILYRTFILKYLQKTANKKLKHIHKAHNTCFYPRVGNGGTIDKFEDDFSVVHESIYLSTIQSPPGRRSAEYMLCKEMNRQY